MSHNLHFIQLKNTPIFEQLQLEEALLRTDERNFCIVNQGSPRAIVMGISGQPEKLLNLDSVRQERIPVIKRFSGGGTVIVDEHTLFITFIFSKSSLPILPFPESILRWSAALYSRAWQIPEFHLRENDYCIGDKKCGGNAQYIQKGRWLHHTSFLWDYTEENMKHLLLPPKRPQYRQDRPHTDFLTRLRHYAQDQTLLVEKLKKSLGEMGDFPIASWEAKLHRQATHLVEV